MKRKLIYTLILLSACTGKPQTNQEATVTDTTSVEYAIDVIEKEIGVEIEQSHIPKGAVKADTSGYKRIMIDSLIVSDYYLIRVDYPDSTIYGIESNVLLLNFLAYYGTSHQSIHGS